MMNGPPESTTPLVNTMDGVGSQPMYALTGAGFTLIYKTPVPIANPIGSSLILHLSILSNHVPEEESL